MIKDVLTIVNHPLYILNKGIGENRAMVRNENDPEYVCKGPTGGSMAKNLLSKSLSFELRKVANTKLSNKVTF